MTDQPDHTPQPDAGSQPSSAPPPAPPQPGSFAGQPAPLTENDARMWSMIGHLGGIILGFLAPLITWLVFRERSALVEDQGKEALNFQITLLIGYVVSFVLMFVVVGFILLPIVWVVGIVFAVIAGMAANRGEHYRYPLNIRLVK